MAVAHAPDADVGDVEPVFGGGRGVARAEDPGREDLGNTEGG
ncbi:MAG: hypothetical protein M5U12_02200 [Verrucomicrobia bacterium]|nr:hypothetical protein [Verrucomicrobiota bacterium]